LLTVNDFVFPFLRGKKLEPLDGDEMPIGLLFAFEPAFLKLAAQGP
jgi:hypothetical protein